MRKLKKKGKKGAKVGWCKRKGMAAFGSSNNARESLGFEAMRQRGCFKYNRDAFFILEIVRVE
ncbi:hypothetical protein DEO72_LG1g2777 [Vigna unguiculata]|uniref:Uncharacterized protein n=1 Tax=Vigna unguiculata TaxID=3917 RepID=A0A4D6KN97_VIGUN|nr:hypothetical protein DEO72_LG1g2777 [Vigna unguiculata]